MFWVRIIAVCLMGSTSWAQILVEDPSTPNVGKKAAADYFKRRQAAASETEPVARDITSLGGSDRYLSVHLGTFINDKQYRWGREDRAEDVGEAILGVTYRFGEWVRSSDFLFRAEITSYEIDDETPIKLSLLPIIAFPDARSGFPLYFGAGLGLGMFFEQVGEESDLSADYALIVGARINDLWDGGGLMFETGLKGHIHLLSSGQQDGIYFAAGGVFEF